MSNRSVQVPLGRFLLTNWGDFPIFRILFSQFSDILNFIFWVVQGFIFVFQVTYSDIPGVVFFFDSLVLSTHVCQHLWQLGTILTRGSTRCCRSRFGEGCRNSFLLLFPNKARALHDEGFANEHYFVKKNNNFINSQPSIEIMNCCDPSKGNLPDLKNQLEKHQKRIT